MQWGDVERHWERGAEFCHPNPCEPRCVQRQREEKGGSRAGPCGKEVFSWSVARSHIGPSRERRASDSASGAKQRQNDAGVVRSTFEASINSFKYLMAAGFI